jgi:GTPase SAR1 family protein
MGICAAKEDNSELKMAHQRLEAELRNERLQSLFKFKILLLGAGESGKSTIVKQLRLVHNKKPSKQELITIGDSLHQNVIDCMKALLYACKKFDYDLDDDDKKTAQAIMEYDEGTRIPFDFGEDITRLFVSDAIKSTYKRRDEFWLLDSCGYYLKHLDRFCEIGFTPNEEDQVMARIRTTGIVVSALEERVANPNEDEPDTLKLLVVDVGGQRNERKKWMHCFDDVKCILFIVNLAGYNQVLFEDTSQNRMTESLELLNQISHRPIFLETPLYVFLNKKDLFEGMLSKAPLKNRFPDYAGGANVLEALTYIESEFRKQMPSDRRDKIKCFAVTGVVKKDVGNAFQEVKADLMKINRPLIDREKEEIAKEAKREQKGQGLCG